jgi:hypothetical protein
MSPFYRNEFPDASSEEKLLAAFPASHKAFTAPMLISAKQQGVGRNVKG